MRFAIHPAAFLGGAVLLSCLWLWLRPLPPAEPIISPRGAYAVGRAQRASIKLDPSILERYVGKYEGRADFTVELSMKDGRLYAQSPGTISFEMLATSSTEFFLKESPDIDVKFVIDGRGAVTGFEAATPYGPMSVKRLR